MTIVNTLAPLILVIALGAGLAHLKFLGQPFIADLNKLAYWIALPALIFLSAARAAGPVAALSGPLVVLLVTGIVVAGAAWVLTRLMRVPPAIRATFVQCAFSGNLAFVGVPVVAYSMAIAPQAGAPDALAAAVLLMAAMLTLYNALAVMVLHAGRSETAADLRVMVRSVIGNPLLIAGFAGGLVAVLAWSLPQAAARTLDLLGAASVPIALLGIGGTLTMSRQGERAPWVVAAAILKVGLSPAVAWFLASALGLSDAARQLTLLFAACPTATGSYVLAREMDGDEVFASATIAVSTVLSAASLAAVLWLTAQARL